MSLVYSRTDSGLTVAEHGAGEAAVARELRTYDPDLRLIRGIDPATETWFYKVYRYAGSERPAEFLFAWMDAKGQPLPLSMRLLEKVREQDRNTRAAAVNEDIANELNRQRLDAMAERDAEDAVAEWLPREKRSAVLHRGQHLRMARDKQRAKGRKV